MISENTENVEFYSGKFDGPKRGRNSPIRTRAHTPTFQKKKFQTIYTMWPVNTYPWDMAW